MPAIQERPRSGFALGADFLKANPTIEAIEAELDRLGGVHLSKEDRRELHGWLLSDGADYRLMLSGELGRLKAERNKAAMRARREAEQAAEQAKRAAQASLTTEQRLARLEELAKQRGWSL